MNSSYTGMDPATTSLLFGILGFVAIVSYIVGSLFLGMVFKKAGIPAWKAWVPMYNAWVFLELGGQKGWISLLLLLSILPVIGIIPAIVAAVYMSIAAYKIGLGFGKEGWFVLLYIFFGIVWFIWLAVDKTAVWNPGPQATLAPADSEPANQPTTI